MKLNDLVKKADKVGLSVSAHGGYYYLQGHGKQGIYTSLKSLNAGINHEIKHGTLGHIEIMDEPVSTVYSGKY
jgi:hypothetical protein